MTRFQTLRVSLRLWLAAAALLLALAACSSYTTMRTHEDLEDSIYAFNKRFEGKMMEMSVPWVIREKQEDFLRDSLKVQDKVIFYDASILNVKLFQGADPVRITGNGPENEFNTAEVLIRYQFSVLPGTSLKTRTVTQKWLHNNQEGWRVDPDLAAFFE